MRRISQLGAGDKGAAGIVSRLDKALNDCYTYASRAKEGTITPREQLKAAARGRTALALSLDLMLVERNEKERQKYIYDHTLMTLENMGMRAEARRLREVLALLRHRDEKSLERIRQIRDALGETKRAN